MLFQPLISRRSVEPLEHDSPAGGHCFIYRGGPYAEASRCWVVRDGLLSRYNWVEEGKGVWEVILVRSNDR